MQAGTAIVVLVDIIVIPTYNEAENIADLLDWLLATLPRQSAHVLVVDDSSPDGTGDTVRAHPRLGSEVFLETRATKEGLGGAYRHGFRWAHEHGYDRVVQMDADGSHDPAAVRSLLEAVATADIAVGSRYVPGGTTRDWPAHRQLISRWATCTSAPCSGSRSGTPRPASARTARRRSPCS